MNSLDRKIVRSTTLFAGVAALAIGLLIPASFYIFGYRYHTGYLDARSDYLSYQLSGIVGQNPDYWQFEAYRMVEIVGQYSSEAEFHDRARVFAVDGVELKGYPWTEETPPWPVIRSEKAIFDFGVPAGRLVLERTLRPLLFDSLGVSLLSAIFAAWAFVGMRLVPLRALQRAVRHISFMANHDDLTKLPNRRRFSERLNAILDDAKQGRYRNLAVSIIDLDRFKEVNDTLGHHAGDLLLLQAAERIANALDDTCTLARLSGDEFAIVQTAKNLPHAASAVARTIVEDMSRPFNLDGAEFTIGASIGVALYPHNGRTPMALMLNADAALYRAKSDGRGRFCYFDQDMQAQSERRRALKRDLQTALVEGQFEVHYQPQIDLTTNKVVGAEALLRWTHPERGAISPADFIPIAEESSVIMPLGDFVLRQACKDAAGWGGITIAVNVSPIQFRQSNLAGKIKQILDETGLPPERLELEITEGILLQDTESTIDTLNDIKALGVCIAMDDFGTGYSSLSYLRRFQFDKIKIDRCFINELGLAGDADAIVKAAINLGQSLGIRANAEGVETADQAQWLTDLGCQELQGFHFARPVRAIDFAASVSEIEKRSPVRRHTLFRKIAS